MPSTDDTFAHQPTVLGFVGAASHGSSGLCDGAIVNAHVLPQQGSESEHGDGGDQAFSEAGLGQQLLKACLEGAASRVTGLLKHGANIEFTDDLGRTPAMIACLKGHQDVLKALMSAGFNQLAVDAQGNGMDYYLAHFGHGSDEQLARSAAFRSLMTIKRIRESGRA